MIKLIVFSVLFNTGELQVLPPDGTRIEARRRNGKGGNKRRRGGNGLRENKERQRYYVRDASRMVI